MQFLHCNKTDKACLIHNTLSKCTTGLQTCLSYKNEALIFGTKRIVILSYNQSFYVFHFKLFPGKVYISLCVLQQTVYLCWLRSCHVFCLCVGLCIFKCVCKTACVCVCVKKERGSLRVLGSMSLQESDFLPEQQVLVTPYNPAGCSKGSRVVLCVNQSHSSGPPQRHTHTQLKYNTPIQNYVPKKKN